MPMDHPVMHIRKTIGEVPHWTSVDETLIFGRDHVKNQIISKLIETKDQQKIKIVSVLGLGGSGKTTLAKLIHNDGNIIKKHFEVIQWVHVSREFVVEKLVEKLFEAIFSGKGDRIPLEHVSRKIIESLAGKRFLLVLDDVWTDDRIHWEQFMVHLKSSAPGSSILLTTRSREVAEAVDSTYTCDLPYLSEGDSWEVFQQSFGMPMKHLDPEFRQVGIEIVYRCGGLPLAIKALSGVLRGIKGLDEWKSIRDSNLLDVEDKEHTVSACLRLTYFHLPHLLQHCFAHCSIFPRGYVINRHHLISQWIAHSFVYPTNHAQQLEDVGIGYFDSLLKVGFLQDHKQYDYNPFESGQITCIMHDLVHDLARQIVHDDFVFEIATTDERKRCRYLSLTSCTGEVDNQLFDKVHALYVSRGNLTFDKTINKRSCVRTIILDHINVASLPLFESKFEYLGYLEISNNNFEALPEAISHCWNLQAIHVIKCKSLATLPESIGRLKKLRIVELKECPSVRSLPQSIGSCDNLQSLYLCGCGLKDIPDSIANIIKLRVLSIVHCTELQQLPPAESFVKLCNLQTITLSYCWNLRRLAPWIILLSHLEHVDLARCHNLVELPEGIGNLKKLLSLNLQKCYRLCGLPAGCGQLTRLQNLGLYVVGNETNHARISELENLGKLNGEMLITNINNVKDPCDAEKVHLKKKIGIRKLSLHWYSRWNHCFTNALEESVEVRTEGELLYGMEKELYLLNCLEPPPEIEKLKISGYQGSQLPCWMMRPSDSCDLDDMHMPKQSSPPEFSHLTKLVLENLSNLEHLWGLVDLLGIKILKLRRMPKLGELLTTKTSLAFGKEEMGTQYCFPHLSDLVICDCPKLIVKPCIPMSLTSLTLEGTNEQFLSSCNFFNPGHADGDEPTSSSCTVAVKPPHLTILKLGRLIESSSGWDALRHLSRLQILKIHECEDLKQLPESMRSLSRLARLEIRKCNNLCMLPEWIGELQSLEILNIFSLPKISILPQSIQHLTALQRLRIGSCDAFHRLPEQFGELCSIQHLELSHLRALSFLPESMQRLTSLQHLNLTDCHALTQLPEWLGELSALRSFYIQSCRGLTSLPCCMQRLTALEKLLISYNPDLIRRCKERVGEDWHLVSHIPDLILRD